MRSLLPIRRLVLEQLVVIAPQIQFVVAGFKPAFGLANRHSWQHPHTNLS